MKLELLEILHCPTCQNKLALMPPTQLSAVGNGSGVEELRCEQCGRVTQLQNGIPLFTIPPSEMAPSQKIERGPHVGTPWRRANWRFLEDQITRLTAQALVLDVGAGRGDFSALLAGCQAIALDIYPYPEVDLVCDLTLINPFRSGTFDAILLMNVLEHVYNVHALLKVLVNLLRPGGCLIIAIPFMVKLHQVPVDYVRFTHFAIERLAAEHGLVVEQLEGYYDPIFFLGEGLGNLRWAGFFDLPASTGSRPAQRVGILRRFLRRALVGLIQGLANLLGKIVGPGRLLSPAVARSQAPTGYHVVLRK